MSQLELIVEVDEEQLTLLIEDAVQHLEDISAEAGNILQREVDGLYAPDTSTDKVDKEVGKSLISDTELLRLATVATDATKNASDASLRDRSTHTGTQPINTVEGLTDALASKVGKVAGYSLVADDEIAKLLTVEQDAQKNTVSSVAGRQGDVLLDKSDVGLGSVNNTSDADKPVSTAVADALAGKVNKVVGKQLSDENYTLIEKNKLLSIQDGAQVNTVDSVAGKVGVVLLDKADVGLSSVDNTSDINKPISNPTQDALDNKVGKVAGKGLSDTNFTQAEKDKLSSLEGSKFVGLFASESALPLSGSEGDYANVDGGFGSDVYRVIWDSSDGKWVKMQGVSTDLTPAQIKQMYESNPDTNSYSDDDKSVVSGVTVALSTKVDKVAGKQLSDENYTLAEKQKLSGVAVEATKNRDDSENADKVHTHTISDVTGLPTRLSDTDTLIRRYILSTPFTPYHLFIDKEKGFWADPSDTFTLFQNVDGTIPVTANGDPIGLVLDKTGNNYDLKQTVSASRPKLLNGGIVFDRVDDALTLTVPADGITGTLFLATTRGTASYGVSMPAGVWTLGNAFNPLGNVVSAVLVDRVLTVDEKARLHVFGIGKGGTEFGVETTFFNAFREWEHLVDFPLIDISSVTTFQATWWGCSGLTSFPVLDVSSGTNFISAWRYCSGLTSFPANFFDNCLATNFTSAFSNTKLSQSSIDGILVSINSNSTSNGTFNQSGGSAPSAVGQAAIDAMRVRGWTVTTTGGY